MPMQIQIPASEVKNRQGIPLVLENGLGCSRCNQSPAEHYEVHRLNYRVGFRSTHLYGKKYRISNDYVLKLKVCETCFQSDFLTHPELLDHDNSPLARIARFHSIAWSIGGLLAAFGFLFLTPIIPSIGVLNIIKQIWQLPVIMGVLVLFLTWLSQKKYQTKVLREIEKSNPAYKPLERAELHTYVLENEEDPSITALEVILKNESWAEECAVQHQWKHRQDSTPENETLEKG
jgi:hypothetical protein